MADPMLARLGELFEQAVELPPAQWPAFAAASCAGNDELRDRLLALLERDRQLGSDEQHNPFAADTALIEALPGAVLEGRRVGVFRIAERIGDGGMGSVYRAVRVDGQVEQEAALKLVRADRVNPYLLHRFSVERRVLAALDHPGICRFLDAGLMDGDRPYVLMELVRGQTFFVYCDSQRLGLRARLELFCKVLAAVGHAHRNLVVHRDIKSNNVLVNQQGEPKLVDFGIAKTFWDATAGETATQDRFLTPSAAAPEQIEGKPVTVAADVYALGALLYELLSGAAPFEFEGRSQGEVERLVREVPPLTMSRRVLDAQDGAARVRGYPNKLALANALRGDLDLIVATCLRKQSEERYASVEQLDAEIERFLQGRAIQARGNERWYRVRRFVARNRLPVALAAGLVLSLLLGMSGVLLQTLVAREERNQALIERDRARSAVDLLSKAFTSADPARVAGEEVTARDILDAARPALEERFDSQPELYASLATVIADVEIALRLDTAAAVTAARGLEAAQRAGLPDAERRPLLLVQARALVDSVHQEVAERALDEVRRMDGEPRADWLLIRGLLSRHQGAKERSIAELSAAVDMLREQGPDHDKAAAARWMLADAYNRFGMHTEAVVAYQDTHRWMLEHGLRSEHPRVVMNRMWLVDALRQEGRLEEAWKQAAIVLDNLPETFGERSAMTARAHNGAGMLRREMGDMAGALFHLRAAYEIQHEVLGQSHPDVGRSAYNLALYFGHLDEFAIEAERLLHEALIAAETRVGVDSQIAGRYRARLARQLSHNGKGSDAINLLLERPLVPDIRSLWEPNLREVLSAECEGHEPVIELVEPCARLRNLLPSEPNPQAGLAEPR